MISFSTAQPLMALRRDSTTVSASAMRAGSTVDRAELMKAAGVTAGSRAAHRSGMSCRYSITLRNRSGSRKL